MTTVTAVARPARALARAHTPGFGGLLQAEWTKIRSVRSTVWSLVAMVVVTMGLAALATSVYVSNWDSLDPANKEHVLNDAIGLILQPGAMYSQIAICVLGVMVMASEYSTGTIRSSVLAVPRRTPLLAAKGLVLATLVFAVALLIAFPSFYIGQTILESRVSLSLTDPGVLRAVLGLCLYLTVMGLFALALGALIRHAAAAITVTLGLVVVVRTAVLFIPGKLGEYVSTYMPGGSAGESIMSSGQPPTQALVTPWQGFGVMCLWTALLLGFALYLFKRRDA